MLLKPSFISDVLHHSMGNYLYPYLSIKIHPLIESFQGHTIIVRGKYDRKKSVISQKEKTGKLFNWKRPTAEFSLDSSTLYINCFPGQDYAMHYAALIKTYLVLKDMNINVMVDKPSRRQCFIQLAETNIAEIPSAEIIVFGKVEDFVPSAVWEGRGDFLWVRQKIRNKNVLFLGCSFSVWGDVAGALVSYLARQKIKAFIYVGKLGALKENVRPNETIATGNISCLNNWLIGWKSIIRVPSHLTNVRVGKHITLFSPIEETNGWIKKVKQDFSFVDPEIGHMAYKAQVNNIRFGYIHLISDNAAKARKENLSNEREAYIIQKRCTTNFQILEIIQYSIERLEV